MRDYRAQRNLFTLLQHHRNRLISFQPNHEVHRPLLIVTILPPRSTSNQRWILLDILLHHPQLHLVENGLVNRACAGIDIVEALPDELADTRVNVHCEPDVVSAIGTGRAKGLCELVGRVQDGLVSD